MVFKGSGWYINDSKGSNKSSTVTPSKKSEATDTKATDTNTADAKPAEKAEKPEKAKVDKSSDDATTTPALDNEKSARQMVLARALLLDASRYPLA